MSDIDWQGRYEDARDDLKAMRSRAEEAEEALATARHLFEAMRDNANAAVAKEGEALDKVAALEARLAEVGPVVEAAERLEPHIRTTSAYMDGTSACCVEQKGVKILGELRGALRAARAKRGAGEGGGA